MRQRVWILAVVIALAAAAGGCAAGRAFDRAAKAARSGDWDTAVTYYRRAVQASPDRTDYKIALERAMRAAADAHIAQARAHEAKDDLENALREYRRAAEFDPSNRNVSAKATELEKTIRDRMEAARPKPPVEELRERARRASPQPTLNPASRAPLEVVFRPPSTVRQILDFIGSVSGINVAYERDATNAVGQQFTVELHGVTLEEALNHVLTANGLFYKVLNSSTILVIPESPTKRAQYEEQVLQTFFVSHAKPSELAQILNGVFRGQGVTMPPLVFGNDRTNTIVVRATAAIAEVMEQIIRQNDRPRAEVVIDVEILEVNKGRVKQLGLELSNYSISGFFSPEAAPTTDTGGATTTGQFNLNTITRGVSPADFYLTVPSAVVRFLESDSETKLVAKPQLRGTEGEKLTLHLGDRIPIPSTIYTPLATGGAGVNPLTSFTYEDIGVKIEMTPRVTYEGDVVLQLKVDNSSLGQNIAVAGQSLPSFGSRVVETWLRLRDGESNLLAGLLREDTRKSLRGLPGVLHIPFLRRLFSSTNDEINQTDIVMLLTPRIVRTHELTEADFKPIYIGTAQNLGLSGPPPLIQPPVEQPAAAAPPPGAPRVPPGSSPIPGTTTLPGATPPAGTPPATPPAGTPPVTPPPATPPAGTPPVTTPPATPPAGTPPVTTPPPIPPVTPLPGTPPEAAATPPAAAASRAQILITPPGTEFQAKGGPYTVPISITDASRVSTVSLTLTYDPAVLRVRSVQEGTFMRQGGVSAVFTQQSRPEAGRLDVSVTRTADKTGASGMGLLAVVLFDAVGPGSATLSASGVATGPEGTPIALQIPPVTVTVK